MRRPRRDGVTLLRHLDTTVARAHLNILPHRAAAAHARCNAAIDPAFHPGDKPVSNPYPNGTACHEVASTNEVQRILRAQESGAAVQRTCRPDSCARRMRCTS